MAPCSSVVAPCSSVVGPFSSVVASCSRVVVVASGCVVHIISSPIRSTSWLYGANSAVCLSLLYQCTFCLFSDKIVSTRA